jgi:hypothetical protein
MPISPRKKRVNYELVREEVSVKCIMILDRVVSIRRQLLPLPYFVGQVVLACRNTPACVLTLRGAYCVRTEELIGTFTSLIETYDTRITGEAA